MILNTVATENIQVFTNVVNVTAIFFAFGYVIFIFLLIRLVIQKIKHSGLKDEDYKFAYPFSHEEKVPTTNYTDVFIVKRSKYDKGYIYFLILLFPLYLWGFNYLSSNYQDSKISKEYPSSWGEVIANCENSIRPSKTGSIDTGKIALDSCKCRARTQSLYATNPYEYHKKYDPIVDTHPAIVPEGFDTEYQACLLNA